MLLVLLCIMPPVYAASKLSALGLSPDQISHVLTVGRCRARCADKFRADSDAQCEGDQSDCYMCWENCAMMEKNWATWGPMCADQSVCFVGCQTACEFYRHRRRVHPSRFAWSIDGPLVADRRPKDSVLDIQWSAAEPVVMGLTNSPAAVYALFYMSRLHQGQWFPLPHTLTPRFATNDADVLNFIDQFLVVAVNRFTVVATASHVFPQTSSEQSIDTEQLEDTQLPSPALLYTLLGIGAALFTGVLLMLGAALAYHTLRARRRTSTTLRGRHYAFRAPRSRRSRYDPSHPTHHDSRTNLLRVDQPLSDSDLRRAMFPMRQTPSPLPRWTPSPDPTAQLPPVEPQQRMSKAISISPSENHVSVNAERVAEVLEEQESILV